MKNLNELIEWYLGKHVNGKLRKVHFNEVKGLLFEVIEQTWKEKDQNPETQKYRNVQDYIKAVNPDPVNKRVVPSKRTERSKSNVSMVTKDEFIIKNKTACYQAFRLGHEWKTPEGMRLVELARKQLGYSPKTFDGDIYSSLWNTYKKIMI